MKRLLCLILCMALMLPCMGTSVFAEGENLNVIASIAQYHVTGAVLPDDGYIGIPVEVNTYIKGETTPKTQIILYVMNTNTQRIGTEGDDTILSDLLDEGYIVVVLDYKNNPKSVPPDLDWSIQGIRDDIEKGVYLNGALHQKYCTYVLPAGYRIEHGVQYWSIDEHGADGSLDYIIRVWNNDFRDRKGNYTITYADGTTKKVKDITATTIDDCVKPDGTPIDLDLRMDIIYPSRPESEVPVMILASSAETRVDSWSASLRPHLTGYLFSGYAGVVYDHPYVPMARDDHYGYFDGTVTGHSAFTLMDYTGVKAQTAAIRRIRYLADAEPEKYKFNKDKFGGYGHSKGAWVYLLGLPHPELEDENSYFYGHHGETAPGVTQPWLTYKDGTPIPSNIQMVYMSHGGGRRMTGEGMAPTFISVGEADGDGVRDFLPNIVSNSRFYDVPSMAFTMPGVGHTIIYGYSEKYDVDMYQALFDFSHYYLKDDNAVCEYITPLSGTKEFDVKDSITLKFTGPIPREEVERKVTVTNLKTGEKAAGVWETDLGGTTWKFTAHNLKGGSEYEVLVPETLVAENGKPLKAAKSAVIQTKYESMAAASGVYSDAGNLTLTKTETADDGVYFVFTPQDFASSTTTALRFSVENEAANDVLVYGIDTLDESDVTNSVPGALIGEVKLAGKGDYELDVTDYVGALGAGQKAAFLLKAEKNIGTSVVTDVDFETADSRVPAENISTDYNNTEGGSKSCRGTLFERRRFIVGDREITKDDYGRRFHISFDLLLPVSRRVTAKVRHFAASGSNYADLHDGTYQLLHPEANVWNRVEMDYVIDDPSYCDVGKDALSIRKDGSTLDGGAQYLYVDNLKVTEEITEAKIAPAATNAAYAPSLVLHPADKKLIETQNEAYVENGKNSNVSFAGSDTLLVGGRWLTMASGSHKKAYARIALNELQSGQVAQVALNVTGGGRGEIAVYGITDPNEAANWSADTINYMNAPANNRFGFDADKAKVYGGAPIGIINVSGTGRYTVDVTEYTSYMKDMGGAYGTLIFVMNSVSKPEQQVLSESFDGGAVPFEIVQGGDIIGHGISSNESRSGSASYMMNTAYGYDRLKFDILDCKSLSTEDVGKRFTVTYWMKSDKTGSFFNSLLYRRGANEHVQSQVQHYNTANTWQQITYSFTLTEEMIHEGSTAETIPSYLNFQLDKMGARSSGKTDNVCIYIDDLTVTEDKVGEIAFDFVSGDEPAPVYEKTIGFDDLDVWRTSGSGRTEVNSDFDMGFGGGVQADLKGELVGADVTADHTTGSGKSLWLCMPNSWNRFKFYNFFDHNLTQADIGRTFRISFWAKADKAGAFDYGFMSVGSSSEYTGKIYESESNKKMTGRVTDTWTQFTYDVTVEEAMLASYYTGHEKDFYNPALFSIVSSGMSGRNMYVDDFVITETTSGKVPYVYRNDMENSDAEGTSWSVNGMEDWREKVAVTEEENHTIGTGKSKSLRVRTDKTYNRLYLYNIMDQLTAKDVGRTFRVNFWMKADKAGRLQLSMSNKQIAGAGYEGEVVYGCAVAENEVGKWKKYSYDITVSEAMVTNGANLLELRLSGFGQQSDGSVSANLYFDDISSVEYIEGAAVTLSVDQSAVISNSRLEDTGSILIDRNDSTDGIRKSYLRFAGSAEYENTQRATLQFDAAKASGQTIKVYGIVNAPYPDELTYTTAPATEADEGMNPDQLYGGAPLAEIKVNGAGTQSVDVTDYIKYTAPGEYIFALVSENAGGTEYTKIDFESFPFSKGIDYSAFGGYTGATAVSGGKAVISGVKAAGEGIQLLNMFGNGAVSEPGRSYQISMDVTPNEDADITLGVCGKAGNEIANSITQHIAAGETRRVEFTYTAGQQDAADGITVYSGTDTLQSFAIDNVEVKSDDAVVVLPGAKLAVEQAKTEEPAPVKEQSRLTVSANGGGRVIYAKGTPGEQDWATGGSADFDRGTSMSFTAVAGEGSRFAYWIDRSSDRIVSDSATYTFTLGMPKQIEAFFVSTEAGVKTAIFRNKNNKILQSGQIDAAGSVTVPSNPVYMGYVFEKWLKNGIDQTISAQDSLGYNVLDNGVNLFTAQYAKTQEKYTVTVAGGTLSPGVVSGQYAYDTRLSVTLDESAVPAGQKFSHWVKDGQIVSYDNVYSFYVGAAPVNIGAVYVPEDTEVEKEPILAMANPVILSGQGKIAFFAERSLDARYTLIETGILLYQGADPSFDLDTPGVIKSTSISGESAGQYTVRVNAADGDTWYAKAFMLYTDGDGKVNYAYSNTVNASYMDI